LSTPVSLPTARIEQREGLPFSAQHGDVYHSAAGAIAQARHVFLAGNGLPARWSGATTFTIVETGFGLGINFLATWDAWRRDSRKCGRLHFISVESTPVAAADLERLLRDFEELAPIAREMLEAYPPPLAGFHRMHFDGGRVILTLLFGEASDVLPQLVARADAFYLDGFSPARNPGPWTPDVVRELSRLAAPGATLATWTVAGGVRAALASAGFEVQRRPGLPPKREMLTGHRARAEALAGRWASTALVIGGGLAGTLVAERLALREWDVRILDARTRPDAAAVGLLRPIVNLRDALNARISRSAFLYALQHYRGLQSAGFAIDFEECGVLQLADDADEAARFEAIIAAQQPPASMLAYADGPAANALAGRAVRGAGWWFPHGSIVSAASLVAASGARTGARMRRLEGVRVDRLECSGGAWRALDAAGTSLGEAACVVLANASDAARLAPEARLRLSRVRGQVTYLPPNPARTLSIVVSGSGYVAPMRGGGHCVGATYQHDDADEAVRAHDHRANLERAASMLPGFDAGLDPQDLGGWTGFRTTVPDRLPVAGLTETPGLAIATGLGSRGLLWGPLAAELLACELAGEPLPVARDHAGAISPRRFLS
jgi:tRNA 5-methylaminomethyl-2-thiouridine biosynthesis bifunctional protein